MGAVAIIIHFQPLHLFRQDHIVSLESELASIMVTSQRMLTRLPQQILPKCSSRNSIVLENQASFKEHWSQKSNYIFEAARVANICNIEAINIRFIDPLSKTC